MKRIYLIFIALVVAMQTLLAAEPVVVEMQTAEQIRAAAREQVISSLNLSDKTRRQFEPIYDEYRAALAEVASKANEQIDDVTPLNAIKANLASVAATAQVKLDYIDRFAELLSSDQIRQLYNSEGTLAWTIRQVAGTDFEGDVEMSGQMFYLDSSLLWQTVGNQPNVEVYNYVSEAISNPNRRIYFVGDDGKLLPIESAPAPEVKQQYYRLNGNRTPLLSPTGQTIEQDYGKIVKYHTLRVVGRIKVIIAPSVSTLKVRCDRAFMDVVKYDMRDGELILSIDSRKCSAWTGDMGVEVYLPVSPNLNRIYANGSASVQIKTSLRTDVLTLDIDGRSSVSATGHLIAQKVTLNINGYSKFDANVFTTNRDGTTMSNGMVFYNVNGRSKVSGTIVANTFVGKANGYSDLSVGTSIRDARFVLNGRSKLNGEIGATSLRIELNGYSDVVSDQITFEKSAVFLLDGRSSITAKRVSGTKFSAKLASYSKLNIGSGRATEGFVTLSGRSECNAPNFDVRNLTVVANDYSSADVFCSGTLRANATHHSARINYSGNCTVEAIAPSIQRK